MKSRAGVTWIIGLALAAGPAMIATAQQGQWEPVEPQGQWSSAWHQGFHEGAEAARRDMNQGRHPDADDHPEFRHPDVGGPEMRHDFRDGFRRGYNMVVEHQMHGDHGPSF